jgi:hypothetical protein
VFELAQKIQRTIMKTDNPLRKFVSLIQPSCL